MSDLSSLHDMVLFVEVARTRSFSAAGRNLGVPTPTLSRRIAAMEARLGVRLFERSTRRVTLTDAGQRYFDRCANLADEARLAEEALLDSTEQPTGHLRLSMPVDLGINFLGPLLYEFGLRYPLITFEFDLSSLHRDLAEGKVDVAFRLGEVKEDQLVARRIGFVRRTLFAAPAYLKSRGHPLQPADLAIHQCIGVPGGATGMVWRLLRGEDGGSSPNGDSGVNSVEVPVQGRFLSNNIGMMKMLAERGGGIAPLQPGLVVDALDRGTLEPVLPGWEFPRFPLYAVTTSRMQPARVKLMLDFIMPRLKL